MARCHFCGADMAKARSCAPAAFHVQGTPLGLIRYGQERGRRLGRPSRCRTCGVAFGGWHHPGCDREECPRCRWQLITCRCVFDEDTDALPASGVEPFGVDANGCPSERLWLGDQVVIVHHDDIPHSDITTVDGIPVTTALRTIIDLAPELNAEELAGIVRDALDRRLFTIEEAHQRLQQPDMANRRGAHLLHGALPPT